MEKRTVEINGFTTRDRGGKIYLEGYFARFDEPYKVCDGWVETIERGAFSRYLASEGEVKALWNHNHDLVLGSRGNGTLTLKETPDGLFGTIEINKADSAAMDAYARVKRGDVTGCSFGFDCKVDSFTEKDGTYRTVIREVYPLYEVSPCVFPAYESTSIEARKRLDKLKEKRNIPIDQWRQEMRRKIRTNSFAKS